MITIIMKQKLHQLLFSIELNNEIGRITGYSSAEMFWWQVDEILDRD